MGIYNEQYLQEMKTKEEYRKESFKKKYNYKPIKKNIGKIKDQEGVEYLVKLNQKKTGAKIGTENGEIELGKDFFKLKGSNHNERRDAILQHEMGHHRNQTEYYQDRRPNKLKELEKAEDIAKKYDRSEIHDHINYHEPLADAYSVSKTSKRAMKKGLRNINKINKPKGKDKPEDLEEEIVFDKDNNKWIKTKKLPKNKINKLKSLDYKLRSKALNDKDLKNQYNKYDPE